MHEFLRIISHHLKIISEKTNIATCHLHSLFVVGSGNSYSNFLFYFFYYIISIIHPLFCYSLPYLKSGKKFSSLMDAKPTANQLSATITTEGMSARRIWGRVSVCLGN
jgi:hypothetical protein